MDETLLARLDERTKSIEKSLLNLQEELSSVSAKLEEKYITHSEFWPIKALVYGAVGSMLTAIIGSVLMLVLKEVAI